MALVKPASAPLLPNMLAVRDYAWSYAQACGAPAGLDYVITRAMISRTYQLELPHSFLQVMMEEKLLGLGRVPVAELLLRRFPRVLVMANHPPLSATDAATQSAPTMAYPLAA